MQGRVNYGVRQTKKLQSWIAFQWRQQVCEVAQTDRHKAEMKDHKKSSEETAKDFFRYLADPWI
jgi:hypothetical protein